MIEIAIASAIHAAALQSTPAAAERNAFAECVKKAADAAKDSKVAMDGFIAHLQQACSAESDKFKTKLVAFDVKNGIKRAQASEDADLQLEDYYAAQEDRYRYEMEKSGPAKPVTPPPQQAASPAPADPQPSS